MVSPGSSSLLYRCITPADQIEMAVKDAGIKVRLLTKWILTITWKAGGDGRVVLRRVA